MKSTLFGSAAILIALLASVPVDASTITAIGSDLNSGAAAWRTDSVDKPLDIDGDDIYGTDGWAMWLPTVGTTGADPASCQNLILPNYIESFNLEWLDYVDRLDSYAQIDAPSSMGDIYSSNIRANYSLSTYRILLKFTLKSDSSVPESFVFGVMADNMNTTNRNASNFHLSSDSGSSAAIALPLAAGNAKDGTPDMYLFKVDNAEAGETLTLRGKKGNLNFISLGGLTWDSATAVPEPSTLALLLSGLGLLIFRRVKR